MTQKRTEKLMATLPKIYTTALTNYSYFLEALRVCHMLQTKEPFAGIVKLESCLQKMCKQNDDISNDVLKLKALYDHVHGKVEGLCIFDEVAKDMFLTIDAFEDTRNNTLFINADFKKYIEPKMDRYFRNLMKDEKAEEKETDTTSKQEDACEV